MYPFVCTSLRSSVCLPVQCFQTGLWACICLCAYVCVHMFPCICLRAYVCQRVDERDLSLSVDNSSAGPETVTELLLSLVLCHDHWPTGSEQREVVGGDCSNTENVHGSLLIGKFVADCHLVWVWPQNRVGSYLLVIWDTQKWCTVYQNSSETNLLEAIT